MKGFSFNVQSPTTRSREERGRADRAAMFPTPLFLKSYFTRNAFLGILFCVNHKDIQFFLAQALAESRRWPCCINTCGISDLRIWPKLPQIETTFPLLYRTLWICMIDSCKSKTLIIGFFPTLSNIKTYLTDANLGVVYSLSSNDTSFVWVTLHHI